MSNHFAYYNEFDPYAAKWIRNLIRAGVLMDGEVDERSIEIVQPEDLYGFTRCHFFAGIGGWEHALNIAQWPKETPVWTGSCPCQPFSIAGKRKGNSDKRHLWPHFYRLISACSPAVIFGEQVSSKDALNWLDGVSTDLESEEYTVEAVDFPACGINAPHIRNRLWWTGYRADQWRDETKWLANTRRQCDAGWGRTGYMDGAAGETEASAQQREWMRNATGYSSTVNLRVDDSKREGLERSVRAQLQESINGSSCAGSVGTVGMGHTNHTGLQRWSQQFREYAYQRAAGETSESGGVDNAAYFGRRTGRESMGSNRWDTPQWGAYRSSTEQSISFSNPSSSWSDYALIPCLDNKTRRTESGIFPLAYGLPANMGCDRPGEISYRPKDKAPLRKGILKGYGNAIVPQLAAEFVIAFIETKF